MVVPLEILKEILILKLEAVPGFLEDKDDVGGEEDHEVVIEDEEIAMFEAVGVPELFKCGDVRPFIFDWEALEGRESDAGWGEV